MPACRPMGPSGQFLGSAGRNRMSDTGTGTGKVIVSRSMSLDGFIAGPGDAMDWIFDFVAPDAAWLTETAAATGPMLIGRRTGEVGNRMDAARSGGQHRGAKATPFPDLCSC